MKKQQKILCIITALLLPPVGALLFSKVSKELEEIKKEKIESEKRTFELIKQQSDKTLEILEQEEIYIKKLEKRNKQLEKQLEEDKKE